MTENPEEIFFELLRDGVGVIRRELATVDDIGERGTYLMELVRATAEQLAGQKWKGTSPEEACALYGSWAVAVCALSLEFHVMASFDNLDRNAPQ